MFDQLTTSEVLAQVHAHEFGLPDSIAEWDFGSERIDALNALERSARAHSAETDRQVRALLNDRRTMLGPGSISSQSMLGLIGEVALALGCSNAAADTVLATALTLEDLPHVEALLAAGDVSDRVVRAVSNEFVSVEQHVMRELDERLARVLPGMTPRRAQLWVRRELIALDVEAAAAHADAQKRATDPRTRGQITFQTLVERITGAAHAEGQTVEVGILIPADTMLGTGHQPGELLGHGPIDSTTVDRIVAQSDRTYWRRLFTDPVDGTLVARDPRRRRFTGSMAGFIKQRDWRCRRPGCDCRTAQIDPRQSSQGDPRLVGDDRRHGPRHRVDHANRSRI